MIETEVSRSVGGRYTFQETLFAAVEQLDSDSEHEFVRIPRGVSQYSTGTRSERLRRARQMAGSRLAEAINRAQDEVVGRRPVSVHSSLERELARREIDLVWFPTMYAEACDRPFIYTVLDVEPLRQPWFPEATGGGYEWRRQQLERYARKATRVIVPNEVGARQIERLFAIDRERMLFLPHPTPSFAIRAVDALSRELGVATARGVKRPYLFYPAQYWPHKNHATLLQALRTLVDSGEDLDLVCVGSDQGALEHVRHLGRELGVSNRVHHLGLVSTAELVDLYRQAHALVYLSWFGPENLPPMEAFALGCPAVCSAVEGAREQYGDACLLVGPTDVQGVADAVKSLADTAIRSRLIQAGRRLAAERTPERYVQGIVAFLDEFEPVLKCWR
jgi:glycosyltransferase involved in cell wall biosynthesis